MIPMTTNADQEDDGMTTVPGPVRTEVSLIGGPLTEVPVVATRARESVDALGLRA
jgi:hypothetical protein